MRKLTLIGLALASLFISPASAQAAVLDSPAAGAVVSGLGFISGWKCEADNITVVIDENGEHLSVAMHQERGDLRAAGVCGGTINHGFIRQINWALLGDGEHVVVAYDDGVEFARSTFTVGTTGEEFLEDVRRRTVLDGFPSPGEQALLEWNESTQHFEIVTVWGTALDGAYDRSYWRQYIEDQRTGAHRTDEELYAEVPDVETCFAGRLTQAAKNRALTAMNQIRSLHNLSPVQYSSRYDEQIQAAALIHSSGGGGHYPPPSTRCYTEVGAEGSRTSNLWGLVPPGSPMEHLIAWTSDADNSDLVAAAGHRRWILNPFATYMSYGQVQNLVDFVSGTTRLVSFAALKVAGFDDEPDRTPLIEVEYVAFPYETYPYHLVEGDPPWSFSVIVAPDDLWANRGGYFREATITVTRVVDGAALTITDRYTDISGFGIPNFLSWQVEGWEYDTLYEVEIGNVILRGGRTTSYAYSVFIERDNLEQ